MEIWIRKIVMAIMVGIGIGLAAASLEPPAGSMKQGYSVNPYKAGSAATLMILGVTIGRRRIRRKKKPKDGDEDLGAERIGKKAK